MDRRATISSLRPNQLLAVSLPHGPLAAPEATADARAVVDTCRAVAAHAAWASGRLLPMTRNTERTIAAPRPNATKPTTRARSGRGSWAPMSTRRRGWGCRSMASSTGSRRHLGEWGLGSISETADGIAPHDVTGCPFQAWSVAEILRVRRSLNSPLCGTRGS